MGPKKVMIKKILTNIMLGKKVLMMLRNSNFTKIGTQITHPTVLDGAFDPLRPHILYTVVSGPPAQFVVFNWHSEMVVQSIPMPEVEGAWAITMCTEGKVYIGTYSNGHLYQYCPNSKVLRDLGEPVPNQTHIWTLCKGPEGKIYGGTYGDCTLFLYDPIKDLCEILKSPVVENENYLRNIAYDKKRNQLYLGIGSHAHLVTYNCATGETIEWLPKRYKHKQFAYYVDVQRDHLFVKLDSGNEVAVIDLSCGEIVYELPPMDSYNISPLDAEKRYIYYSSDRILHRYDFHKNCHESLDIPVPARWARAQFVEGKLMALLTGGGLFQYHPTTGQYQITYPDLPKQECPIQSIIKGPDGNIYIGGYLVGGMARYNPSTGISEQFKGVDQAEGMTVLGNQMYLGIYRDAIIYEYNPYLPWNMEDNEPNPKKLFQLSPYHQDRPFAMVGIEEKNLLAIGTFPDYGTLGGALTIYNPDLNSFDIYEHLIPHQSIASLVYQNDYLIGGTSIWGGIGSQPIEKEAKLFMFDLETRKVAFEFVPIPNKKAITSVKIGPDGMIWGFAEGALFIFDPMERKVIFKKELFDIDYSHRPFVFRDAAFEFAKNGLIYGTIGYQFFELDPTSMTTKILREELSILSAMDDAGNIYFAHGKDLWKYTFPSL